MPKLPGISHATAIRVFNKFGYHVAREGKHTFMSNGRVRLIIPRHAEINAFTMGDIAKDAGLIPQHWRDYYDLALDGWLDVSLQTLAKSSFCKSRPEGHEPIRFAGPARDGHIVRCCYSMRLH